MLQGKTVVLGVTGSIAAYKMANVASMLKKLHADVYVLMTKNATNFINPITFETLTGHKCLVDTFDRNFNFNIEHVSLAKKADYFLVAPASADVIGKMACGIADDMLTTTALACRCPVAVAPAMNTAMYENRIVQDNLAKLKNFGVTVIEPASGNLACGDSGKGKLPPEELLIAYILREIACEKDFAGKRVLVTAGATRERLDPVRFLTNFSTGKMGYAVAKAAMLRGADVTLVTGAATVDPPEFVRVVRTESAEDMYRAVMERCEETDIFILSAAVADFKPEQTAEQKIKKGQMTDGVLTIAAENSETDSADYRRDEPENESMTIQKVSDAGSGRYLLPLVPTKDILKTLGAKKRDDQYLCGFAMETEQLLERAAEKRIVKNADMICANSLSQEGAGFGTDTNVLTLITAQGADTLPVMSKEACAHKILDEIGRQLAAKN